MRHTLILITLGTLAVWQGVASLAFGPVLPTWYYVAVIAVLVQACMLVYMWLNKRQHTFFACVLEGISTLLFALTFGVFTSNSQTEGMRQLPITSALYSATIITGMPAWILRGVSEAIKSGAPNSALSIASTAFVCLLHYSLGVLTFTEFGHFRYNVADINLFVDISRMSGLVLAGASGLLALLVCFTKEKYAYSIVFGVQRWAVASHLLIMGYAILADGLSFSNPGTVNLILIQVLLPCSAGAIYIPRSFPGVKAE